MIMAFARPILLLLTCLATSAWAASTLTHVAGQVSVLRQSGQAQSGVAGTVVQAGETVTTGASGFVRMRSTDGGWMVLPPNSQMKIESYVFEERKPAEDSFVFSMLKGAIRTATGLIGKRGNRDAYAAKTATATIGIRGTQYDMRVCDAGNCGKDMPDGTYVAVRDGAVAMTSQQGTVEVQAGQAAAATRTAAPRLLDEDPGIGFATPELFASKSPFHGTWTGRVTSAYATFPAAIEITVQPSGQVTGAASWNTKAFPPEAFVSGMIQGNVMTYNYKMNYDIGKATLTLVSDELISVTFDHGGVVLKGELTKRQDEYRK